MLSVATDNAATAAPSGRHDSGPKALTLCRSLRISLPSGTDQILIPLSSRLPDSIDDTASFVPSGENRTARMDPAPVMSTSNRFLVSASHSATPPSPDPMATRRPSGLTSIEYPCPRPEANDDG
jgi:hypothetical protein